MEARRRALQCLQRHRAGDVRDACEAKRANERERGHAGHELRPVDEREPFLRLEHDRREPCLGECIGAAQQPPVERGLPLAHEGQRQMRQRCEVAARADRPPGGHVRHEPRAEDGEQQLDRLDADAGVALRERVRPEQHRGPHDVVGVRLADTAGVAAEQSQLELGGLLGRDRLGDEAPEARVHAVRMVADLRLEELARRDRSRAAPLAERHLPSLDGDVPDILDREVVTRQLDRGRHAPSVDRCRGVSNGRPSDRLRRQLVGRSDRARRESFGAVFCLPAPDLRVRPRAG